MIATSAAALLAGCSQAPAYRPPAIPAPVAFKEAGPWVPAAPSAPVAGDHWWEAFGDPQLDALEAQLAAQNPTLAVAYARWHEARAAVGVAKSAAMPEIDASGQITANRQSDDRPLRGANQPDDYGAHTLAGSASYELDLWGRVHDRVLGRIAAADAGAEDAAAAKLSLEADLADDYLALAGLDREAATLGDAVAAYARADRVTQNRLEGGIATGIDVGRSEDLLADAQGQLAHVHAQRAQVEHAIAALVGETASAFSLPPITADLAPIAPPAMVPSALLQRRPDIAAAERRMYAANREIGVARAAFYPSLAIGGGGGVQSTVLSGLLSASNLFWSVGPSLSVPIFEGGRLRAHVQEARARWDEATGQYRETTLGAFREVEDALAGMHWLSDQAADDVRASQAASQAARLSWNRYIEGTASFLDVVTAQTADLTARRAAIAAATARAQASVDLVRAMGGGWRSDHTPASANPPA